MIAVNSILDVLAPPAPQVDSADAGEGFSEELSKATADAAQPRKDGKPDGPQKTQEPDGEVKADLPEEDEKAPAAGRPDVTVPMADIPPPVLPVEDASAGTGIPDPNAEMGPKTAALPETEPREQGQQIPVLPQETPKDTPVAQVPVGMAADQDAEAFAQQAMQEANAMLGNDRQTGDALQQTAMQEDAPKEEGVPTIPHKAAEGVAALKGQQPAEETPDESKGSATESQDKDTGAKTAVKQSPMTAQVGSDGKVEFQLSNAQLEKLEPVQPKESIRASIIDQVKSTVSKEKTEFFLQLKPEHLGGLSILLSTEEKGVAAKLMTSSHDVQQVLQSDLNQLQAALRDKGINVVHMEVIYDQTASSTARDGQGGSRQQGGAYAHAQGGVSDSVEDAAAYYDSLSYYDVLAEQGGSVEFSA